MRRPATALSGFCLALALSASAQADPDQHTRLEIEFLLNRIRDSGCIFIRNGIHYNGAEAAAHLRAKYGGVSKNDRINSTDDFIRLIASTSSMTGRNYLIQCASNAAVPTREWLEGQLANRPGGSPPPG